MECEKPRCPQKLWYGIPNWNPSTSASGSTEHNIPKNQNFLSYMVSVKLVPIAIALSACPNIEAILFYFFNYPYNC